MSSSGRFKETAPVCFEGGWCTRSQTTGVLITSWRGGITATSLTGAARTTPWAPCVESASTKDRQASATQHGNCQPDTYFLLINCKTEKKKKSELSVILGGGGSRGAQNRCAHFNAKSALVCACWPTTCPLIIIISYSLCLITEGYCSQLCFSHLQQSGTSWYLLVS